MNVYTNRTEILYRIYEGGFRFSIISLISSFIILLIIAFNKILRSLTYNFLICVFISEFFGSLGNICEYQKEEDGELLCKKASYFLIPLSDSLTMSLFCFFSYCSIELIIKSNKNIKQKEKIFLVISFIISICYSSIIGIILYLMTDEKNVRFYFYEDAKGNFIRFIHIGVIICATCYMFYNTYAVIQFLKEKQKIDRINSWKIAKLSKILFRFPLICLLYWIFYIPSLSLDFYKGSKDKKLAFIFKLFSQTFFTLRGFLITLNTIHTNKVQILLQRFFEIHIKHVILGLNWFSKKRSKIIIDKNKEAEE